MGELVLITGTSSGIGLATALACARAGHRVIATMRNLERKEDLERATKDGRLEIAVEHLDVTSSSVGMKVRELVLKYGPMFGLANNPGFGFPAPFEAQTVDHIP